MLSLKAQFRDETLERDFVLLSTGFSQFLKAAGYKIEAYTEGLPHFRRLKPESQATVLKHLRFYNDLCETQQIAHESLRESKKLTWRALSTFGFTPPAELMDRILDSDVVEVHSEDHVQLFRNFEFFNVCSYNLEELFCIEWWNLYQRDPAIDVQLLAMASQTFAGKAPEGFYRTLPRHTVVEALSSEKFHVDYEMQYLYPLYRNKRVEAVLSIVRAKLLV